MLSFTDNQFLYLKIDFSNFIKMCNTLKHDLQPWMEKPVIRVSETMKSVLITKTCVIF